MKTGPSGPGPYDAGLEGTFSARLHAQAGSVVREGLRAGFFRRENAAGGGV